MNQKIRNKGVFITFEGSEGSGKSTQMSLLARHLQKQGASVVVLREPGGTVISESVRKILLNIKNTSMTNECETLLYMAARAQIVEEMILPALKQGQVVLCDRYLDSTVVYQGYGNDVDMGFIRKVGDVVTQGIKPDMTLLFDIDTKTGLSRTGRQKDRIELRSLQYHNRVRKGYLELAQKDKKRIKVINVDRGKEEIHEQVRELVEGCLAL